VPGEFLNCQLPQKLKAPCGLGGKDRENVQQRASRPDDRRTPWLSVELREPCRKTQVEFFLRTNRLGFAAANTPPNNVALLSTRFAKHLKNSVRNATRDRRVGKNCHAKRIVVRKIGTIGLGLARCAGAIANVFIKRAIRRQKFRTTALSAHGGIVGARTRSFPQHSTAGKRKRPTVGKCESTSDGVAT